jgi:hypothetical protein
MGVSVIYLCGLERGYLQANTSRNDFLRHPILTTYTGRQTESIVIEKALPDHAEMLYIMISTRK